MALCGCGRPLSGDGGGQGVRDLNSEPGQGRLHKEACVCPMIGHGVGGECGVDALGLSTGPVAAPLDTSAMGGFCTVTQVLVKYELMPKP